MLESDERVVPLVRSLGWMPISNLSGDGRAGGEGWDYVNWPCWRMERGAEWEIESGLSF